MKLTPDQQKILLEKLNLVWSQPRACPICNSNDWTVSENLFELREHFPDGRIVGEFAVQPVIAIRCRNCGYTHLLNAIFLGIVDAQKSEEKKQEGGAQ